MLTDDEMQHIATILEARMHDDVAARKATRASHWKRRSAMVVVVLVMGYTTHKALEIPEISAAAQSFELILASMIDSIYSRVKEM